MNKRLTESTISECQTKFNLSHHVPYAHVCQELIGFEGKDVLEVGGSLPREFVFDYLNVKSWSAIETPDYESALMEVGGLSHQGTIIHELNDRSNLSFQNRKLADYNFFLENIENLPSEYYDKYDLVFSTAAFEHILKFPSALEKMFHALKPEGQLFSMFSPIWSACDGHHLPKITDQQGTAFDVGSSPIPPWGHLLMKPSDLCRHLNKLTDEETANSIVYFVYNSPHINRFFTEDYVEFIEQSLFRVRRIELTYISAIREEVQLTLEKLFSGRSHFNNNGILVVLEKRGYQKAIYPFPAELSTSYKVPFTHQASLLENSYPLPLSLPVQLREINLIIFPDWSQEEESLSLELAKVIRLIAAHPDRNLIALLIDTSNISEEEAELVLSSVVMHLLMEDDLDISDRTEISLVGKLTEKQWLILSCRLYARIVLHHENQEAIAQAKAENLASWEISSSQGKTVV